METAGRVPNLCRPSTKGTAMATAIAPAPSVPREARWAAVEAEYAQLRLTQVEHGDLSPQACDARRQVALAWMQYECFAFVGLASRPVITHRPLVGETLVELDVDVADMAYHLCIRL